MSNPWLEIQDLIGPAKYWPTYMRRMFWSNSIHYYERMKLASFGYVNGVAPLFLVEVLQFTNRDFKPSDSTKIIDLYLWWMDNPEAAAKYRAYHVLKKEVQFLGHANKRFMFPNYPSLR